MLKKNNVENFTLHSFQSINGLYVLTQGSVEMIGLEGI